MKKTFSLFLIAIVISIAAKAQPLTGIKTIGTGGDYVDIPAAISALITNGISANVTFNIKSNAIAYTVGNQNITTFTGHGLYNVSFQAESGNASDVKIENFTSHLYIFHCYGVDNITFKNLSLKSNSTSWSNLFMLDYDSDNITIENCNLVGNYNGFSDSQYSLIYVDDFIASDNSNCDNLIVRNCLLNGGKKAISVNGNSSGAGAIRNQGLIIENDSIVNQKEAGINITYCSSFSIKNNLIKPTTVASPTSMFAGITLAYCDGNFSIEKNQIYISNATPVGNLHGIFVEFSNHSTLTTAINFGILKNNMVHLNGGAPGSDAIGIVIQDCNYTKLFHNTVRTTADGYESYCVKFNSSTNIVFKNNLLQVGTIPLIINKDGATTLDADYNVYFGFNGMGTNDNGSSSFPNTLNDWQLATSIDANSIYKQVTFYGDYSTLELAAISVADHAIRVPILPSINQDIYDKTRQTLTCAGAFERFGPMNGLYIINNSLQYPSPAGTFVSYGKAVQALASGVSGPVSFEAVGGSDYVEQIEITSIEGANSTNKISFNKTAAGGFPVLKYTSSTLMDNYVVRLDSVQNISFANTSFSNSTLTTGLGKVFEIINGSSNISFLGCNFYGAINPGSSYSNASLLFASSSLPHTNINNVSITGSQFMGGDYGVYVYGDNTNANGWYIHNNSFSNQTYSAIDLNYVLDAEITINTILGNSFNLINNYFGINCYYCDGSLKLEKNNITITALGAPATLNQGIVVSGINPIYSTNSNSGLIANNMIKVTNTSNLETNGITLFQTGYKNVYHNTVITDLINNLGYPIKITTILDSIKIKNNIFVTYQNEPTVYIDISSTKLLFNYNNLKTKGTILANINAIPMFIANMQGLGYNLNSNSDTVLFVNPFAQPADLHLSGASIINSNLKGTKISILTTTDIDGDVRDNNTPFMGADEGCQSALVLTPTVVGTQTVCNGFPLASATAHYGGQTKWYTTASGGTSTLFPIQTSIGTYTLWVSEKLGNCETARVPVTIINNPAAEITVIATVNSGAITDGKLFLFKQNLVNNRMDTIRFENITSSTYTFTGLYPGNYLIYFKPNKISHPNVPGRFNGNVAFWENASFLYIACSSTNTYSINATNIAIISGPGSISGKVQKGVKFGKTNLVGDPIPGVDISLEQNPGGIMVSQTETNSNGEYSFASIPLADYRVKVNIPGTPHSAYYDITIDSSNPVKSDLIYVVDSTEIYPLSDNINLSGIDSKVGFKIIPNPTSNQALIDLPSDWKITHETLQITITDISGKTVSNFSAYCDGKIILKKDILKNGMYFVKVSSNKQSLYSKLILVD